MDVMARYFATRGHQVTTVSSRPGRRVVECGEGGKRILARPIAFPGMSLLRLQPTHTFLVTALRELRRLEVDVVHSLLFTDALAAVALAKRQEFATVFQMNGVALPGQSCRRFPPEAAMYRRVMRSADALIACSGYIRALVLEHYGVDSVVIPPMVDVAQFSVPSMARAGSPTLLAAGDFTVPRKGIGALLKAFPLAKRTCPDLVLNLSGRMPERLIGEYTRKLPEKVRRDIRLLGLGTPEQLPRLYAEASLLVLPAMGEPSGTVLMEAWAAGTPVVTADHGGVPEFVNAAVGVLFDPRSDGPVTDNAEGLADAIIRGLDLAARAETAAACRAHAREFAPERIGPRIEALYRSLR